MEKGLLIRKFAEPVSVSEDTVINLEKKGGGKPRGPTSVNIIAVLNLIHKSGKESVKSVFKLLLVVF